MPATNANAFWMDPTAAINLAACLPAIGEKRRADADRNSGLAYENGQGVDKNPVTAAKLYQQALEKGCTEAQADLDRLFTTLTGAELNNIGCLYYKADGIARDYGKAKRWFEKAKEKASAAAYRNLGYLYKCGAGVAKDPVTAANYYLKALELGHNEQKLQVYYDRLLNGVSDPALKKSLERNFERSLLHKRSTTADYIEATDAGHNTLLHRAAQHGMLKNCARFLLLGAKKEEKNSDHKTAFSYLNETQSRKITHLQAQFTQLLGDLRGDAAEYLAVRVFVRNASLKTAQIKGAFLEMYGIEQIKPLMDLAKLCVLGLHDLAKRKNFEDGYDSDNDDDEAVNDTKQKLSIVIDAKSATAESVFHAGTDGQDGKNTYGLYACENTIYLGGDRLSCDVRATLIHELTHFLAQEIGKNKCKPYEAGNTNAANNFEAISADLYARRATLDVTLQHVYTLYPDKEDWHAELIVRVPQMILQYSDGLQRLKYQAPALLAYYEGPFLTMIKNHIVKLEARALSGWNKDLFQQQVTAGGEFHLDQAEPNNYFNP